MTGGEGLVEGGVHRLPVRIYYEDTDFSGVVYHANYLRYCERGRSDFLRIAGVSHRDLAALDEPLAFSITRVELDFLKPARIDQRLEVRTVFPLVRGPRIEARQAIVIPGEALLLRAQVFACCITMAGKPRRMPTWAIDRLNIHTRPAPDDFESA